MTGGGSPPPHPVPGMDEISSIDNRVKLYLAIVLLAIAVMVWFAFFG